MSEVRPSGLERGSLFDLEEDPGEGSNLTEREPALRDELIAALEDWDESLPGPPDVRE